MTKLVITVSITTAAVLFTALLALGGGLVFAQDGAEPNEPEAAATAWIPAAGRLPQAPALAGRTG